jgi:hypothetical protein
MPQWLMLALVALAPLLQALVFRLFVGLGFGIASYIGLTVLMANAAANVATTFTGLGADLMAMAYILKLDQCINLLFSAYTCRLSIAGMTALGVLSKVIQTGQTEGS